MDVFFGPWARDRSQSPLCSSPGLLDNSPEQIRNKLKILAYVLETTEKNISKVLQNPPGISARNWGIKG